jgi:microcompartment protein CcmL/EutN
MRRYPAIAIIEFSSIADGIYCTDALLKKAPIAMLKTGTVSDGRYLIIIGGSTASVEASLNEALEIGQASRLDHAFLPDVHEQLHDAVLGQRQPVIQDAVAILETSTVAANVRAAELALKGTNVSLTELRLADYEMSGKAISLFNGELHDVEAAMDLAGDFLRGRKEYVRHRIIAQPHETLTQQLGDGTRFNGTKPIELAGEEVS